MVSKKEPKARTRKAAADKDDPSEAKAAAKKPKPVKAQKKRVAAKTTGKSERKHDSAKHHKIRIPATARKNDAGSAGAELDPFEVAKQSVKGSVSAIVAAMVEKAKQGSCTHAKTLLEMTGAKHMFDGEGEAQNSGEPWAKLVLERLDEADGRGAAGLHQAAQEAVTEQQEP